MARGNQREPRCSNSWRPSDGPLSPQAGPPQREQSPVPFECSDRLSVTHTPHPGTRPYSMVDQGLTPDSTRATPESPFQTFKNPNLMPVVPRHPQTAQTSLAADGVGQFKEIEEERLPQIWHTSIDDLIRRTAHDFDLVMNYRRDAEGGQRWTPGDIAHIRDVGKNLHRDIFALRRWQRVVAQQGDQDKIMMMHIKREANFVKLLCERVQSAISKYEQKCNLELLRDGVYAQDEDGNLYKPTAPQEYVVEGGHLHDVTQMSDDGLEDSRWDYPQDDIRGHYQDHGSAARLETPPDTESSSLSKGRLAFDFAFQSNPVGRPRIEATHETSKQPSEQLTISRSGRLADGRILKPHQERSRSELSIQILLITK
ncbi:hypothetical protein E8E12_009488 [Didymella heteroderae]|uniref:Uncharacterized protein n=1 Tax=Didymella heteroderae TaxID=1769908 RepID=A0A9P5C218_9PLEO|nr:hypothetical protein E8E12_009488 [Didymella heteroderae]